MSCHAIDEFKIKIEWGNDIGGGFFIYSIQESRHAQFSQHTLSRGYINIFISIEVTSDKWKVIFERIFIILK